MILTCRPGQRADDLAAEIQERCQGSACCVLVRVERSELGGHAADIPLKITVSEDGMEDVRLTE
jgi:hypothetical protein